jgi:pimeloyl-ACP methyl ester carboxylesterase
VDTTRPAVRGGIVSPGQHADGGPVIYVRGYAGPARGIDKAADDAFYGFNDGSTHARIDGDGEPMFYQFESPLLRLMIDEDYELLVRGSQHAYLEQAPDGTIASRAIWVYRFYDEAAGTFGEKRTSFDIVRAAEGLYDFVTLVRQKTEGSPKVHLVAHSMGGLVCRTMLQRVCREAGPGRRPRTVGAEMVDRVVTMGTPHRGIETRFALADLLNDVVGVFGSEIFSPRNMYGYLTPGADGDRRPPKDWQPHEVEPDAFPTERFFCVIGTNPSDYGQARHAIGAKSDGLVRVDNAYVRGAPRSFVHRSHSGRFGLVNSEEAYQSLRRFLFGRHRVDVHLLGIDLLGEHRPDVGEMTDAQLLAAYQQATGEEREFAPPERRVFWQADVQVTIRGLPIVLHEQSVEKNCPVQLTQEQLRRHLEGELGRRGLLGLAEAADSADTPVPLTTVFLLDPSRFEADRPGEPRPPRCRYTMRLRVFRLEQRGRFLGLGRHIEQVADWEDALIVDIGHENAGEDGHLRAWAAWNSEVIGPNADRDPIVETSLDVTGGQGTIPLPDNARRGVFGSSAKLGLRISDWA